MAQFTRINGSFFRKDDAGGLYPVTDTDTLRGLTVGNLPYESVENSRGLQFAGQSSTPAPAAPVKTAAPAPQSGSASADIGSLIKEKLVSALSTYKGVTDVSELEGKRQEVLRKQLLSAPYSSEGETTLTGSQKLTLLRGRGSEFEPEIKSLEEQILKARQGDTDASNQLAKLMSLAKEAGVFGGEKRDTSLTEVNGKRVLVDNQTGEIVRELGVASSASGDGGLTDYQTSNFLTKLNESVSSNETYKKTSGMRTYANNVITALSSKNGISDIAAINQFQKVIDEGAVTRDQDVKLIQSSQSLLNSLKLKIKNLENGEQLSDVQRDQMKDIVTRMYNKQVEVLQEDPYIKSKIDEVKRQNIPIEETILGKLSGFSTPQNSSNSPAPAGPKMAVQDQKTKEVRYFPVGQYTKQEVEASGQYKVIGTAK